VSLALGTLGMAEVVRAGSLPTNLPTGTTKIDFASSGYSGTVPTEFGLLTDATHLDLGK
jgi:hypothetical protein